MNGSKEEYLELLNQKMANLQKMLEITEKAQFTGKGARDVLAEEAEAFAALYEKRARIVKKIENIENKLSSYKDVKDDPSIANDTTFIREKTKETVATIMALDKKNIVLSAKFMEFLKNNLKQIRNHKGASGAYTDDIVSTSGSYFDGKN